METVIDAVSMGKSLTFPKPSFDGKYLMYTLSDYGTFSIWHHESDLWLMDLATGESRPLDEVNRHRQLPQLEFQLQMVRLFQPQGRRLFHAPVHFPLQ